MTATTILSISDLNTSFDAEPRILDIRVAEQLGYERPADIRDLIARNEAELETYGEVFRTVRKTPSAKGGRPSQDIFLNEGQLLLLCMLSRAPNAPAVRKQVIDVFIAWRAGTLPPSQDRAIVKVKEHLRRVSTSRATATRLEALVERLERCVPPDAPPLIPMPSQPRRIAGYLVDAEDHNLRQADKVMLQSEAGGYFVTEITPGGTIPCVAAGIVLVAINPPSGARYVPCKLIGKVVQGRAA